MGRYEGKIAQIASLFFPSSLHTRRYKSAPGILLPFHTTSPLQIIPSGTYNWSDRDSIRKAREGFFLKYLKAKHLNPVG